MNEDSDNMATGQAQSIATPIAIDQTSLWSHLRKVTDFRMSRRRRHDLMDILAITICAVICGADDWVSIAAYGRSKLEWFKTFLRLPNGIPSHDTFNRVFALLNPEHLRTAFRDWVKTLSELIPGDIIPIDGKTLRRTFDEAGKRGAIHMISAWAKSNGLVLAQAKVDGKSNEITAIPKLLELIAIKGCIVTIDAMGCQKAIAGQIVDQGGDYVLGLKGNQGNLREDVELFFLDAEKSKFKDVTHEFTEETDGGHGRVETRRYWWTPDVGWLAYLDDWKGLCSLVMVESERWCKGKTSIERRFYISSCKGGVKESANAIRAHWGIENKVHWVLDVSFRQDDRRIWKDNGPENVAIMQHMALNLVQLEKTREIGVKNSRLRAGWDNAYLLQVLMGPKN
jgi:predicted transposase YbfD/YdcC